MPLSADNGADHFWTCLVSFHLRTLTCMRIDFLLFVPAFGGHAAVPLVPPHPANKPNFSSRLSDRGGVAHMSHGRLLFLRPAGQDKLAE